MSHGHGAQRQLGCGVALRPMACRLDGGRGSGGDVVSRLARPAPGRRLGIEPQVGEDLLDHRPLEDGRDDLEIAAAAVRAVLHVDVEHALEQPRPADAAGPRLGTLDPAFGGGCGFGALFCLTAPAAPPQAAASRSEPGRHEI